MLIFEILPLYAIELILCHIVDKVGKISGSNKVDMCTL